MSDEAKAATGTPAQKVKQPAPEEKKSKTPEEAIKVDPKTGKELMHIKLYSPFQVYFNQDAFSLSGVNETGPFDILPRHHNFMTLLGESELTVRAADGDKRIKIARGVMHVKANKVTVFLDV